MNEETSYQYLKLMWDSWQQVVNATVIKLVLSQVPDKEDFKARLVDNWENVSREEISKALHDVRLKIASGELASADLGLIEHNIDKLLEQTKGMIYNFLNHI